MGTLAMDMILQKIKGKDVEMLLSMEEHNNGIHIDSAYNYYNIKHNNYVVVKESENIFRNKKSPIIMTGLAQENWKQFSKDELKRALKEYKGSVLLICHEPEFYEDIVSEVWDCSKWTTKVI